MGYFMRTRAGREYVPRLPDVAYSPLSNDQLAGVLNWVMRRFSAEQLPTEFRPYVAGEIAKLRAKPLREVGPARAQALHSLVTGKTRSLGDSITASGE